MFDRYFSDVLKNAFSLRTESDYRDFYVILREDVVKQAADAEVFFETVRRYIETERGVKDSHE